jgi:hypothetical protein
MVFTGDRNIKRVQVYSFETHDLLMNETTFGFVGYNSLSGVDESRVHVAYEQR